MGTDAAKKWKAEEIKEMLKTNDAWVWKALISIYMRQTEDEQVTEETTHNNGVGFNGVDAPFLSSLAKQVIRWKEGHGSYRLPLSPKQMEMARKRILKYSGQLAKIANSQI